VALKLKTYEDQAKLSVALGVLGALAAAALVALLVWKFDHVTFFVTYNSQGPFLPIFGLGFLGGLATGVTGFFVGLHSAGQRRNTLSSLAWQGFFLNALVLTIVVSAAAFFFFTRNSVAISIK
jgi:hypothetical protein